MASATGGTSAGRFSPAGRSITSRDRRPIRPGCSHPRPAAGSGRSSSVPTMAARPGKRWATSSSTPPSPAPTSGTTGHRIRGSSPGSGTWSPRPATGTRSTPGSRTRGCSSPPTAGSPGPNCPGCARTSPGRAVRPDRIFAAISAAGAFRSDDAGQTWQPVNRGLHSEGIPDEDAEVGHCVHHVEAHPTQPDTLFMQKHWDVMRSDDAGLSWTEVSGNLPTDFGFPIGVHAHEPETVYVVPITSDSLHYPPDGSLQVWRSRSGGNEWEPLTRGLPQRDCYVNVYRDAMSVDTLDSCGVYFGTTGGQVYASANSGDSWEPIVRDLPAVLSVEVQVLP